MKRFSVLLLLSGWCAAALAQTVNPVADTYVRNGSYANSNYGTSSLIEVKQSTISGNMRYAFFRFDIAALGLTTVSNVKLRLYFYGGSSSSVSVHPVAGTWTETGITWNNKPVEGAQIAVKSVSTKNVYHEWDITAHVQSLLSAGQTQVNLVVRDNASGSTMSIRSREYSSNKPQLAVTGTVVTVPPAAPTALLASAISSSQVNLSWSDNSSNESGFKIEYKTGAGAYALLATVAANVSTYSHTGAAAATAYGYRVYAYNSGGNSAYSNESFATTFSASTGTTYYIDAVQGNDLNNGLSPAAAWKNLTKLHALTLTPGTRVYLRANSVWTGQQLKFNGSGTAASPIIIDRYDAGAKPLLHGNGLVGQGVVYLYNQEFIEISNLEITNAPNGPVNSDFFLSTNPLGADRRGVMVVIDGYGTADHIYLRKLDIHHVKGQLGSGETAVNGAIPKRTGGIFFTVLGVTETSTHKSRFNDVLVDSCNIYYCENIGFAIDNEWNVYYPGGQNSSVSADVTEYNNWFDRRNTLLRISNSVFHHIGKNAMIIRMADETGRIERNVCYETAMGTTGNTMFTARCKGTVFQFNEGYLNRATTQTVNPGSIDGSMYDADYGSVGVIFQYSYSHDNSEGLYWGCNTRSSTTNNAGVPDPGDVGCTARYNISQNDKGDLIFFNYPSAGNEIYNNVFYIGASLSPNIIHETSKQHTYGFYNNIIYNMSPTADYSLKDTGQYRNISHNVFYGYHPTGTLTGEPNDPFKSIADPLFVNPGTAGIGMSGLAGYKLQLASPAINSGRSVTANGGFDFWGNALYNGLPDRGAHEYSSVVFSILPDRQPEPQSLERSTGDIRVYPNPFSERLHIDWPEQGNDWSAALVDMTGRTVRTVTAEEGLAGAEMSGLPQGIYILTVREISGDRQHTYRIVRR
jgi:hypothetical protein